MSTRAGLASIWPIPVTWTLLAAFSAAAAACSTWTADFFSRPLVWAVVVGAVLVLAPLVLVPPAQPPTATATSATTTARRTRRRLVLVAVAGPSYSGGNAAGWPTTRRDLESVDNHMHQLRGPGVQLQWPFSPDDAASLPNEPPAPSPRGRRSSPLWLARLRAPHNGRTARPSQDHRQRHPCGVRCSHSRFRARHLVTDRGLRRYGSDQTCRRRR